MLLSITRSDCVVVYGTSRIYTKVTDRIITVFLIFHDCDYNEFIRPVIPSKTYNRYLKLCSQAKAQQRIELFLLKYKNKKFARIY